MRQILFIDAYDSFTNNIVSLLETELDAKVTIIRIDQDVGDLGAFLKPFDAVVAGPGPGSPENSCDVGLIAHLWTLNEEELKPVLGICLGFQSLVCAFGGCVERLASSRHGVSTQIETVGEELFQGLDVFESIQYHSLRASIGDVVDQWQPSSQCPELVPLAWDRSSQKDGPILMGIKHTRKPFWGVQFHPESICSSMQARKVIRNWWDLCERSKCVPKKDLYLSPVFVLNQQSFSGDNFSDSSATSSSLTTPSSVQSQSGYTSYATTPEATPVEDYVCVNMPLGDLDVPSIVTILGLGSKELIVLDSERKVSPQLGRYSIIGIIEPTTTKITYKIGSKRILTISGDNVGEGPVDCTGSVFEFLKSFLAQHKIANGTDGIPFWGGMLGYIDYEACLETIDIHTPENDLRDNISFVFVERSIVVDHLADIIYIQSLNWDDQKWATSIKLKLDSGLDSIQSDLRALDVISGRPPVEINYKSKIDECQENIRSGNSYELCLTNQAVFITRKSRTTPWQHYQHLRNMNPAPFASYIRLGSATILSTSPECFMRWTRPSLDSKGRSISTCQFRPIKGTVQKQRILSDGSVRMVGLHEATEILSTVKETAENLMIVDLIRHDLHGVVGSGNVRVPSLMKVEEYSTVYQLVSVIEGDLHPVLGDGNTKSGIDVLAASLPPGSMTGAPKKRSCEILRGLEDEPRSLYSGVIGYMCVGGGGDFSVTIRTIFKWDDEDDGDKETWRIGAGGAITGLSDLHGEWEEMQGKLRSTQRLFE